MLVLLSVGACMIVPARMFQCSVPAESRAGWCSLRRLTGPVPLKPEERTAHSGPLPRELSTVPLGLGEHHPGKDRLALHTILHKFRSQVYHIWKVPDHVYNIKLGCFLQTSPCLHHTPDLRR